MRLEYRDTIFIVMYHSVALEKLSLRLLTSHFGGSGDVQYVTVSNRR